MSQIVSTTTALNGSALSTIELREILEYEKIVQFRDSVLAGTHPRIKLPAHLVGNHVSNSIKSASLPNKPTSHYESKITKSPSTGAVQETSPSQYNGNGPPSKQTAASGQATISSKSEINPVLLQKSDELIKAEMQLQRQRIERALREQIENQRLALKIQTSEGMPHFDVAHVLSKALAIVRPISAIEADASADPSASESFDENTFYSSQHDTPGPSSPSQGHHEIAKPQAGNVNRPSSHVSSSIERLSHRNNMTGTALSTDNSHSIASKSPVPVPAHMPSKTRNAASVDLHARERNKFAPDASANRGDASEKVGSRQSRIDPSTREEIPPQPFRHDQDLQLIRSHNLSPLAPQPARLSPLLTAKQPTVLQSDAIVGDGGHPMQVASLRKAGISSTDSSPKGTKFLKKKDTKKRRASGKDEMSRREPVLIKPEPRSVSPYGVAPLPRPHKRQRQSRPDGEDLNYEEPRFENGRHHRSVECGQESLQEPPTYRYVEDAYEIEAVREPEVRYRRVEKDGMEYYRIDERYVRRAHSPPVYVLPYEPTHVRSLRAASRGRHDPRQQEEPIYYREPISNASVRPVSTRDRSRSPIILERRSPIPMGPPRQPVRIVVDSYGREYIEPYNSTPARQSIAPMPRYHEPEPLYERTPTRFISDRAPYEYEDSGVMYRRQASPAIVPRRVLTQPEYSMPQQRNFQQREYSVRPMAPPTDGYGHPREASERRHVIHVDELPREYMSRAPSVRPATQLEPVQYDNTREYTGMVPSARPAGTARRLKSDSQREHSVRPMGLVRLDQGRDERYYEEVTGRNSQVNTPVGFIEQPRVRGQSIVVYEDNYRRDPRNVYR